MGLAPAVARRERAQVLSALIAQEGKGHWPHAFEVGGDGSIAAAEASAYRTRVIGEVFRTLLVGRSVLVLDEVSGIYPVLILRAGAGSVSASAETDTRRRLVEEVTEFLGAPTTVVGSRLVAFYDGDPYVDTAFHESHEFCLALGQIWRLFAASGHSFDAIVEACSYLISDGLIFDWNNAEWASPPETYNRGAFCDALRRRFDYVTCYSDWLIVATGKLSTVRDGSS